MPENILPDRSMIPSLNSLRAFEVAARTGSFAAAARELSVSPSAVGHLVRGLEDALAIRLFVRSKKSVTLTESGRELAGKLTEGFDVLQNAIGSITESRMQKTVVLWARPSLAVHWLVPAIEQMRSEGIASIDLESATRTADLESGEADIDVRYGRAVDRGLVCDVLFGESVFPVCSKAFARDHELSDPADLPLEHLLYVDDWHFYGGVWDAWDEWVTTYSIGRPETGEGRRYISLNAAVDAARCNKGIALGAQRHLQGHEITKCGLANANNNDTALIAPFGMDRSLTYQSYLAILPEKAEREPIRRIRRRLIEIAKVTDNLFHQCPY